MARHFKPDKSRFASSVLTQAQTLWERGRQDEALRKYNEAVRLAPRDLRTLIEASRAFGARYQYDRSLSLLERALKIGQRRADIQHLAGETYQRLGYLAEAEACFRRASGKATMPASQLELARLLERRHELAEAGELVGQVLRTEPKSLAARLLSARIARRLGETREAENTLRDLVGGAAHFPALVAEAFGELAALLDARGDYDAAWEAILNCKQIQLARDVAEWKASEFVLGRFSRMLDALRPEHFSRWSNTEYEQTDRRFALLTGFPRSGTTLLEQVLDAHPEIISSEEKEVFSAEIFPKLGADRPANAPVERLLDELRPAEIEAARQYYFHAMEAMLGEPIGSRLHLDKNPAMNLMIPAVRRVFPEMKLVIAVRDPRDVVLSCFLRYLPLNPVSVNFLTLDRTVDRYLLDMQAWDRLKEMHLGGWVEVRYEDLVADLSHEAHRVIDALQLPWNDLLLQYRDRATKKHILSPTYEAVVRPIYSTAIGRWKNYRRQLEPALDRLAGIVERWGYPLP